MLISRTIQALSRLKRLAYKISAAALRLYYRNIWGMDIGEGVLISSTAKMDLTNPKGVHIGGYTVLTFGSAVLTHDFVNGRHKDTRIGSHCFIGAGAKIMPGVTIGDHCIVGPNSVVASNVPSNTAVMGVPARTIESGIVTGKWGIRMPEFLRLEGIAPPVPKSAIVHAEIHASPLDALLSYLPHCRIDELDKSFQDLAIDSFTLVTLRAQIEEAEGINISDKDWTSIICPLDLRRWTRRGIATPQEERVDRPASAGRSYEDINLPQMAMEGLSEGWLFKEVGDVHWHILTSALGIKSRQIADGAGERLYATFTRIRYRSSIPLLAIGENSRLELSSKMSRFGAGMFFSKATIFGGGAEIVFDVATSFSKFGEHGANTSLIKGQPELPTGFAIPTLGALPDFIEEYRRLRAEGLGPALFETEYEILPQHDINGVGLLYFAAYPTISDICLMRHLGGAQAALEWSPVERDICYFANCGPTETLVYRLHANRGGPVPNSVVFVGSLSRKSDGKTMARIEVQLQRRQAGGFDVPVGSVQAVSA